MCGIVGYIGKSNGVQSVVDGLKELEYRGYDSAGIVSTQKNSPPVLIKEVGRINNLEKAIKKQAPSGNIVLGHTRWATHGKPSKNNSHPHYNNDKTIFVVHNGIIENYLDIKAKLTQSGYTFYSETDTEVIPNLVDYYFKKVKDLKRAIKLALGDLRGTYALLLSTTFNNSLYLARLGSPLVIGYGKNYILCASDQNVLQGHSKKISYLNDFDIAEIKDNKINTIDLLFLIFSILYYFLICLLPIFSLVIYFNNPKNFIIGSPDLSKKYLTLKVFLLSNFFDIEL